MLSNSVNVSNNIIMVMELGYCERFILHNVNINM